MKNSLYIVVILAVMVNLAFAETSVDSKVPIGQEQTTDTILIPPNQQFQKANCVVSAVLLDSQIVKVKNVTWDKNLEFTLFEFRVKKDIKAGDYGALVSEVVYVISQTVPEHHSQIEPELRNPKFDKNKEYILFLKETPSYYIFNFVQDFAESIEYSEKAANEITSPVPK